MPQESMNGIRTYFREWSDTESGFQQSYRCIYPLLRGLFFVETIADSCFHFPWDDDTPFEEFSEAFVQRQGNDGLYDVSVLLANDQHVSDDWNSIILADVADLEANRTLANHIQAAAFTAERRDHRIIFFHNFDGAFWQFFTNDSRFIESMLKANRYNSDLDLRLVDYSEHFPDPGEYRDDYPPTA